MQITCFGHASIYVETADVRILIDPVFEHLHQEGLFEMFPPRIVHRQNLPPFEYLFVSHHHLDHFDIATLAWLPRDVQVIIPLDEIMQKTFATLGYENVTSLGDYSSFQVGDTRFMLTPSMASVTEHGIVISDSSGTFWNQVDTIITPLKIDLVLSQNPPIDLLFAPWQPMLEQAWQNNQPLSFPFGEYAHFLQNVGRVQPKALVAGANGFCYTGKPAWLNQVIFPQTRARFLADAKKMLPQLQNTFEADAGDVLEISGGKTTHHRQQSDFISSTEYDFTVLEFRPATATRDFRDACELNQQSSQIVTNFAEKDFPAFINKNLFLFRTHQDWEVIFQLEIAFADELKFWWFDFSTTEITANEGRTPLANIRCGINATGLFELLSGTRSWDKIALGGDFYQQQSVYGVWENGLILPQNIDLPNPLFVMFPYQETFETALQKKLQEFALT